MENETPLNNFMETFGLVNLITEPTCFKSPENSSSIDVILTDKKKSFLKSGTYETGASDHHKLIFTVTRSKMDHTVPKVVTYRDYKNIDNEKFSKDIHKCVNNAPNFSSFHREFQFYLERHAPLQKKILRANHKDFIDKTICKEIMYRSQLKNKFNRNPTHRNKLNYRKQRNKCVNLVRQARRNLFTNRDIRQVQDNKRFWKTVKPPLSSKSKSSDKIILTEHDSIISDNEEITETLNDYFINIVDSLKIPTGISNLNDIHYITDFFRNHHSINKIKEHVHTDYPFNFQNVTLEEVIKEVNNLKDKGARIESIPVGMLKRHVNTYAEKLTKCFNDEVVGKGCFSDSLKEAEFIPAFKGKGDSNDKSNYRPISCLPPLAKVFEKLVFKQLSSYFFANFIWF